MTRKFSVPAVLLAVAMTLAYQVGAHRATRQAAPVVQTTTNNAADFIPAAAPGTKPGETGWRPEASLLAGKGDDLSHALLHKVQWEGRDLQGLNLQDTKIVGGSAREANLREAQYFGEGTLVASVDFTRADLRGASGGMGAVFDGCNFAGADLRGTWLAGTTFVRCDFTSANFSGLPSVGVENVEPGVKYASGDHDRAAQLDNVDLTTCTGLDQAKLAGATYNEDSRFPPGFSPEAAGMVFNRYYQEK